MMPLSQINSIEIIPSIKLEKSRWDECVEAHEGLIYSRSWYLDVMADDWYGLIVGDFEAVLAIPVKRKFGMRMIAMPAFVQRLDLVGRSDEATRNKVSAALLNFSKLVQFNTTDACFFEGFTPRKRQNFLLNLQSSYASIFDNYSDSCKKNLRQAAKRGCVWKQDVSINELLNLYRNAYGSRSSYTPAHYERFQTLLEVAKEKNSCHFAAVVDEAGETVYAGALIDDGRRLYYLMGAPTEKGRHMRATYFFMDTMLRQFAGTRKIFDFEGSDIPDVAKFYLSFSPETEYYFQYYINLLPFPIKNLIDRKLKPF